LIKIAPLYHPYKTELKEASDAKELIKKAKQKALTPVVGNMDPLLDALSSIVYNEHAIVSSQHSKKSNRRKKKKKM